MNLLDNEEIEGIGVPYRIWRKW